MVWQSSRCHHAHEYAAAALDDRHRNVGVAQLLNNQALSRPPENSKAPCVVYPVIAPVLKHHERGRHGRADEIVEASPAYGVCFVTISRIQRTMPGFIPRVHQITSGPGVMIELHRTLG